MSDTCGLACKVLACKPHLPPFQGSVAWTQPVNPGLGATALHRARRSFSVVGPWARLSRPFRAVHTLRSFPRTTLIDNSRRTKPSTKTWEPLCRMATYSRRKSSGAVRRRGHETVMRALRSKLIPPVRPGRAAKT
jgi:hypothetical protein